jgi:hypothetical protein
MPAHDMTDQDDKDRRRAQSDGRAHRGLGQALRALYAEPVKDAPPDRIAELARLLEEKLNAGRREEAGRSERREPAGDD